MPKAKKLGRPKLNKGQARTVRLEIRLTPAEEKKISQAAKGKVATWARDALLQRAKRSS